MVHAKNYETMATFVKVMHKKLWPLFSGYGVYIYIYTECAPAHRVRETIELLERKTRLHLSGSVAPEQP